MKFLLYFLNVLGSCNEDLSNSSDSCYSGVRLERYLEMFQKSVISLAISLNQKNFADSIK